MSAQSTEGRRYEVTQTVVDGDRYVGISVITMNGLLITKDHLTAEEARTFAAEVILAVEI